MRNDVRRAGVGALLLALAACTSTTPSTPVRDVPTSPTAGPRTLARPSPVRAHSRAYLPLPDLTPGAVNANVTQENIAATVCKGGWTSTIRPKSLAAEEKQSLADYNARNHTHLTARDVEYDHLISLQLGGAPDDVRNLFPQPEVATGPDGKDAGSRIKDNLESFLNAQVCGRRKPKITLATAQQEIAGDWYAVYTKLGRPADPYHHTKAASPTPSP